MSSLKSSSVIPDTTLDASGRKMASENRARFSRMRLWDSRSKNNKERSFLRAFAILDSFANKLHLPETQKSILPTFTERQQIEKLSKAIRFYL